VPKLAPRRLGLVEGVDRRQTVGQVVDDRHHDELAVFAEFHQARVHSALQEEVRVLVAAVVVHAAAGMAPRLVAQVERVVLEAELERLGVGDEAGVLLPGAALRAAGAELLDRDAHRHARAAGVAVRTVREDAAAAEARLDEVSVELGVDEMARRCHLRPRHAVGEVAARIRRSHVKLQYGVRKIVKSRHGSTLQDARGSLPSLRAPARIHAVESRERRAIRAAAYASGSR
jgi:hypothetical protein